MNKYINWNITLF